MTIEEIEKIVLESESQAESQSKEYARLTLEGEGDELSGQKMEDHMDAAEGIMFDYMSGYMACLEMIKAKIGKHASDIEPINC